MGRSSLVSLTAAAVVVMATVIATFVYLNSVSGDGEDSNETADEVDVVRSDASNKTSQSSSANDLDGQPKKQDQNESQVGDDREERHEQKEDKHSAAVTSELTEQATPNIEDRAGLAGSSDAHPAGKSTETSEITITVAEDVKATEAPEKIEPCQMEAHLQAETNFSETMTKCETEASIAPPKEAETPLQTKVTQVESLPHPGGSAPPTKDSTETSSEPVSAHTSEETAALQINNETTTDTNQTTEETDDAEKLPTNFKATPDAKEEEQEEEEELSAVSSPLKEIQARKEIDSTPKKQENPSDITISPEKKDDDEEEEKEAEAPIEPPTDTADYSLLKSYWSKQSSRHVFKAPTEMEAQISKPKKLTLLGSTSAVGVISPNSGEIKSAA